VLDLQWQSLGRHFLTGLKNRAFTETGFQSSHCFYFDNVASAGTSGEEMQIETVHHGRYALTQQLDAFIQGRYITFNMKPNKLMEAISKKHKEVENYVRNHYDGWEVYKIWNGLPRMRDMAKSIRNLLIDM